MFRLLEALLLPALMTASAIAKSPHLFTPSGGDDAAALRAALIAYGWVQINGTDIRIDTPINLETDTGVPLHNVLVEPAPGIAQTTIHTAITQDSAQPTNPSRSPFNYNGGFEPGSFLTRSIVAGARSITVRDPSLLWSVTHQEVRQPRPFKVGQYIYLNDTSKVSEVTWRYVAAVQDGAAEVRQIQRIEPSGQPGALRLWLDASLRRPHKATITVAHCEPIRNAVMRNLRFTSDTQTGPRAGIHMHVAFNAQILGVSSMNWRGFSLILLDTGGRNNIIKDCYAAGVNSHGDYPNGWGIAVEGQEGTKIVNSGADRHSEGIIINYSVDTFALNSSVQECDVIGLDVNSDVAGNPSINSGFKGGRVLWGGLGAYIGPNCVDCIVDVSIEYPSSGVKVGLGAYNTKVMGSILGWTGYGIGIDSINGGVADGAVSSQGTLLNSTANCVNTKLVILKGTGLYPHTPSTSDGYYTMAPLFNVCQ